MADELQISDTHFIDGAGFVYVTSGTELVE